MVSLISTLQCVLRVTFALILGHTVTQEIFTADPTLIGALDVRTPELGTSMLCIVLASFSIWLILGVGTRAVALMGLGLYLAHQILLPGFAGIDLQAGQNCILVAMLALPLVLFGGGRFSLIPAQSPEVI